MYGNPCVSAAEMPGSGTPSAKLQAGQASPVSASDSGRLGDTFVFNKIRNTLQRTKASGTIQADTSRNYNN